MCKSFMCNHNLQIRKYIVITHETKSNIVILYFDTLYFYMDALLK